LAQRWPPKAQSVFVRHEGGVSYLKLCRLLEGTIIKSAKIVRTACAPGKIFFTSSGAKKPDLRPRFPRPPMVSYDGIPAGRGGDGEGQST
jgi:hypothetical protein